VVFFAHRLCLCSADRFAVRAARPDRATRTRGAHRAGGRARGRAPLLGLTRAARLAGACLGMTVTQALAIVPSLRVMQARQADGDAAQRPCKISG